MGTLLRLPFIFNYGCVTDV